MFGKFHSPTKLIRMKQLLLSLGVLLLSLPGHAQYTRTFTGALVATDPTIPGDRLFRDGTAAACGTTKVYPSTSAGSAGVHYDTYAIGNSSTTASTCVTVTLAPSCTESTGPLLFVTGYTNTFIPTNLATNYKTDMGTSPNTATPGTMGVTLAPREVLVIVVSGLTAAGSCSSYALTVAAPIALPVQMSRDANAPTLAGFPNPVQDVLHITAAKAGNYTLYSATGAVVKRISGSEVSLRDLPGGVYMLQQDETKAATRIVKL
jgi:hypothetical protein